MLSIVVHLYFTVSDFLMFPVVILSEADHFLVVASNITDRHDSGIKFLSLLYKKANNSISQNFDLFLYARMQYRAHSTKLFLYTFMSLFVLRQLEMDKGGRT